MNACNCERGERLRCETERLVRAEVVRAMRLSERRGATHVDGAHMDRAEVAGKKNARRSCQARGHLSSCICLVVSGCSAKRAVCGACVCCARSARRSGRDELCALQASCESDSHAILEDKYDKKRQPCEKEAGSSTCVLFFEVCTTPPRSACGSENSIRYTMNLVQVYFKRCIRRRTGLRRRL